MSTLSVNSRTKLGKAVGTLRRSGFIPAVLYGHGVTAAPLTLERKSFEKVYQQVGESTLLDLTIDGGKPVKVLIQAVQVHPTSGVVQHVDFHQIKMDEKLVVDIPLKFVGESPAVKGLGGVLVRVVNELKVECLPQDLVHEIEVDISSLKEFNQDIKVQELKLPDGIKVAGLAPDEVVVTVAAPRSEAELAELKAEVKEDVSQVQKVEEKKEATEAEAEVKEVKAEKEKK